MKRMGLARGLLALLLLPGISHALGSRRRSPEFAAQRATRRRDRAGQRDARRSRHARSQARLEGNLCALRPRLAAVHGQRHRDARSLGERRAGPAHQVARRPSPNPSSRCSSKRPGRAAAWCANTPCCSIRRCSRRTASPAARRSRRRRWVAPQTTGQISRPAPERSRRAPRRRRRRRWRQLRSAAWRQPLGHRAPPVGEHAARAPISSWCLSTVAIPAPSKAT